jgi:hypothetical protein
MNASQRKTLDGVKNSLTCSIDNLLHVIELLEAGGDPKTLYESDIAPIRNDLDDAMSIIDDEAGDEQDKFDNLSEGLQQSENGQAMEQAAEHLGEASEALGAIVVDLMIPQDWGQLKDILESASEDLGSVIDAVNDATSN